MFSITNIVGVSIAIILAILFFYKKSNVQTKTNTENFANTDLNTSISSKKTDNKKLTVQERLELSWKFLYEITEIIINKFSKEDIETVNKIGSSLLDSGMRYEHVVDLGIKFTQSKATFAEIEREKSEENDLGAVR
jgi:hypothetical protein